MIEQLSDVKVVAEGFSFLEGPRWYKGRLYVSDFYTQRVLAFDEAGGMELICTVPNDPSGLGFMPDGTLLIVSMRDRRLLRLTDAGLEEVADLSAYTPFLTNDMLVDPAGRAYVGNFGFDVAEEMQPTQLFLVQPNGSVSVAASGLVFPNGVLRTLDGKRMIVAETFVARISIFDIEPDGSLTNRQIFADFASAEHRTIADSLIAGDILPDGLDIDADGAVWAGDAGGRGPVRVIEGGERIGFIDTGEFAVYAVALGGADGRTLFMCAAPPIGTFDPVEDRRSRLLACRVNVPAANIR